MQDIFSFRTPDLTVKSSQALSPEGPLRDFGGPLLHRRLWGKASLSTIRTCLYIPQLIKLSDLISQLLFSLTVAASLLLTRNENLFLNGSCLIYLIAHYYLNFFLKSNLECCFPPLIVEWVWCRCESARNPLLWPGFDSENWRHIWVDIRVYSWMEACVLVK